MTQEEWDVTIKRMLIEWSPEDLIQLRSDCADITSSYDLGKCAQRLHQLADHELAHHHCAGSALYLKAVAKRLDWYHGKVLKLQEAERKAQVIH